MIIKDIVETDIVNYKKISMFITFPYCDFKCDRENGNQYCQNWSLSKQPNITLSVSTIIKKYLNNPMTEAIVCGGLEPFNSWDDLLCLTASLREVSDDDLVIYTGYRESEIEQYVNILKQYKNIIIKFGRYRPDQQSHYDEILGVNLANNEQYAIKIS